MTYDVMGAGALNYAPCRYGNSRILFRGPQRRLDLPYVAFIGGTETYGKFIELPFPSIVERHFDLRCINFGVANAGVDVFLNDSTIIEAANGATATVVQLVGAHNLSNRFYMVHPRRNDRFVSASPLMASIFPEVDFSEFHFTRHLLNVLYKVSPERFRVVREELQSAWSSRMKLLLRQIRGRVLLVWFSDHAPPSAKAASGDPSMATDPLFVTEAMLADVQSHAATFVDATASEQALQAGTDGMVFNEMEAVAACRVLGPITHQDAADRIGRALTKMLA